MTSSEPITDLQQKLEYAGKKRQVSKCIVMVDKQSGVGQRDMEDEQGLSVSPLA
jgi:hypothetical protein